MANQNVKATDGDEVVNITAPVPKSIRSRIQDEADKATIGLGTRMRQIFIEYYSAKDAQKAAETAFRQ